MNNGKIRIYDLSKELNLDNKDIKDICEQLNIAVKSHSSTITAPQADRVKAIAADYSPKERNKNTSKKNKKPKNMPVKSKPKQQILGIKHKPNYSVKPKVEKPSAELTPSVPTLKGPPQMPSKQENNIAENKSLASSKVELKTPPKPNQKVQSSPQAPLVSPPKNKSVSPPVEKPQLVSPPSRQQKEKPVVINKKVSRSPDKKTEKNLNKNTNLEKPKAKTTQPKTNNDNNTQKTTKTKTAVKQPPQLPQLQQKPERPGKIKPSEISATDEAIEETDDLVEDDDLDLTPVAKPTKKEKLKEKPSRPSIVRKGKIWDEEDEDEKKAKLKAANKNKRRPKPIVEDDDDEFGSTQQKDRDLSSVSMSIARPPKPQSLQKQQLPPTATKKPRKSPSKDKAFKERRTAKVETIAPPEKITLTQNLTLRELSELLNTPETDIIKNLFFKGIAVNITQTLDVDTARLVAEELGVEVETPEEKSAATKETEMLDVEDLDNLQLRPPVVTIMGHVDHGKTTLLDSIRKSKVAQGEAGGITQHIGAYHVDIEHDGKEQQIVFLDTPGHEAFTAMRARGTRVTDIAILVVAADDGVQPQTKEAISHAKAAEVPLIVAINKVDKPESNPDRIKQELTEHGLVAEDWGGDTTMVAVSALKGDNLDELLEMILLVAEVEELSANPNRLAKGTIIEANLDRARGPVATLLVQNGTLKIGDSIVAGSVLGKVKAMVDDRGEKVEAATPSFAVEILGLNSVPEAGDEFEVYKTEKEARIVADERSLEKRDSRLQQAMASRRVTLSTISAQAQEGELKELNLILKADVQGSVEAILGSLEQLPQNEVQIRVLLASPGEVTETDVDLAAASGAVIIAFNTSLASGSRQAADNEGVDIRQYDIIYKLLDDIQGAMEGLLDPEEVEESLGQIEVRAVFTVGRGAVAGCYVQSGKVVRNCKIRVRRQGKVIYEGNLDSLKRMKEDAKEVNAGYECGIGCAKFNDWQEGDIIEAYEMVFKRRTLATS